MSKNNHLDGTTTDAIAPTPDDLERCRPAVKRLCYRMLGAMSDADDATQETMIRGWRAAPSFEGRSSLVSWLCRIATRVCIDFKSTQKRSLPWLLRGAGTIADDLDMRAAEDWVEPAADRWLALGDSPEDAMLQRETLSLAWVTALQQLPPQQRACLVLMDVVGLSASETADTLTTTPAAANSALQRARATLAAMRPHTTRTDPQLPANRATLERFAEVFARYDLDALRAMLLDDTTMCMPPLGLWLRGGADIVAWMAGRGAGCRGSRLVRTDANGVPAWAQYRPADDGGHRPWALVVPIADDGQITQLHFFLDTETLFPRFGLAPGLSPA